VTKVDEHRAILVGLDDWIPYLDANSGLPGPRGNLELVAACAEEANVPRALGLIATGDEFATVCGLVALGRHFGEGDRRHLDLLYRYAADSRWRAREGVAMALQRAADDDPEGAFEVAETWATDPDPLLRRAAVAAVCEPRLLRDRRFALRALKLLDHVTGNVAATPLAERRSPSVRTLRKTLGYGWSVAVAALPDQGMTMFTRWESEDDPDICWIVKENHNKARFKRLVDALDAGEAGAGTA
jgi:hypothetical protein